MGKKIVVRKFGEQGSGWGELLIVALLIATAAACYFFVLLPAFAQVSPAAAVVNRATISNIESMKFFGYFEVFTGSIESSIPIFEQLAEEEKDPAEKAKKDDAVAWMKQYSKVINTRYIALDGSGICNPMPCGDYISYPVNLYTEDVVSSGKPATASFIFAEIIPTSSAAEGGTKTKILFYDSIRMVGENNREVGPAFPFDVPKDGRRSVDFLKDVFGQSLEIIKQAPGCEMRKVVGGTPEKWGNCFDAQYYSVKTLVRMGPVPNSNSGTRFFVAKTNRGVVLINTSDLASMIYTDEYTFALLNNITLMLSDPGELSQDNINAINAALRQVDPNITFVGD